MILSQKESMLLQDMMTQEQLCIEKYNQYASKAEDPALKNLFTSLGQTEQQHYNTLEQMSKGTVPQMNAQQGAQAQPQQQAPQQQPWNAGKASKQDEFLCQDVLSTEKHVSSIYDTAIFEFKDVGMRDALNHIQKEEQEHGKKIYDYMSQHGIY